MRLILLFFLLLPTLALGAPSDKPPFFRLEYRGHTAWLLGSVHVGRSDFYPFADQIEKAWQQAEVLALEADPTDPRSAIVLAQYALSNTALPTSLAQKVKQRCKALAIQCNLAIAPWLLSAQLAMTEMAKAGYTATYGVEAQLVSQLGRRSLWELEGVRFQAELFDKLGAEAQQKLLAASLESNDGEALISAWRTGDSASLAEIIDHDFDGNVILKKTLMTDRNRGMARTIRAWMAKQQYIFIAVGAGHLLGEQGVPLLLRKQGVEVKNCWEVICS